MPVKHLEACWAHSRWSNRNAPTVIIIITIIDSSQIKCGLTMALWTLGRVAAALTLFPAGLLMVKAAFVAQLTHARPR